MANFNITRLGDEIVGTFDDGEHRLVLRQRATILRQRATNDFIFDCACIMDNLSRKIEGLKG